MRLLIYTVKEVMENRQIYNEERIPEAHDQCQTEKRNKKDGTAH